MRLDKAGIEKLELNNYKTKEAEKILTDLLCKDLKSQIEKLKLEIQALKNVPNKTAEPKQELTEKEQELATECTEMMKRRKQKVRLCDLFGKDFLWRRLRR